MVGSAIVRALRHDDDVELVVRSRSELDLARQEEVEAFFRDERIDEVHVAAARVGGISANDRLPADFIRENLAIACNLVGAAHDAGIDRLLFLGSSCVYPRLAPQPIPEEALLTGPLEPTNEPYAIAKIAGLKLCEAFRRQHGRRYRSLMPTNLYGPGDNFSLEDGHVLPALLRRFHEAAASGAEEVVVWGTGSPLREFMHVDDLAAACRTVMALPDERWDTVMTGINHLNVGTGEDCSIRHLVDEIVALTGYAGRIRYDSAKPDGTPRKLLDVSRIRALGWAPGIPLREGLRTTYAWYRDREGDASRPLRGVLGDRG
ncbi:GDP-L-fucose synthase [Lysobacter aestuarii]|uniref:GDP-L-fucose synthase n=2 Tax=Marilutibacter aestuarii TaxID=1706195 RepID=A0A507ZNW4_9GAMM|nr:GDP-L-fucose synthase [Lysobacter aestuarii]